MSSEEPRDLQFPLENADVFVSIAGAPGQVLSPAAGGQATAVQGRDMVTHHGLVLDLAFLLGLLLLVFDTAASTLAPWTPGCRGAR